MNDTRVSNLREKEDLLTSEQRDGSVSRDKI